MAHSRKYTVLLRRKREGKTDYKARLKLLTSKKIRFVIRKKSNVVIAQLIQYVPEGDRVIVSATTADLKKLGWGYHTNNLPSSYLLGYLLGYKAHTHKIKAAILDIGLHSSLKGSSLYATLKGAIDAGLEIPVNEDVLPSEGRIMGKHIQEYALKIGNSEKYNRQFSRYIKQNVKPEEIGKNFENIKKKIENK
ncbi:50S ribosomal protein L18 [Candidatus Woesearchaeota archaeon]|nr:50S ribosomal protein L18 [Candidatus Woesearchaeota archaeon]